MLRQDYVFPWNDRSNTFAAKGVPWVSGFLANCLTIQLASREVTSALLRFFRVEVNHGCLVNPANRVNTTAAFAVQVIHPLMYSVARNT